MHYDVKEFGPRQTVLQPWSSVTVLRWSKYLQLANGGSKADNVVDADPSVRLKNFLVDSKRIYAHKSLLNGGGCAWA